MNMKFSCVNHLDSHFLNVQVHRSFLRREWLHQLCAGNTSPAKVKRLAVCWVNAGINSLQTSGHKPPPSSDVIGTKWLRDFLPEFTLFIQVLNPQEPGWNQTLRAFWSLWNEKYHFLSSEDGFRDHFQEALCVLPEEKNKLQINSRRNLSRTISGCWPLSICSLWNKSRPEGTTATCPIWLAPFCAGRAALGIWHWMR